MKEEMIKSNEIYLQDVVCSVVEKNPTADDFILYNTVSTMVDIPTLDTAKRLLKLIKLNKSAFLT